MFNFKYLLILLILTTSGAQATTPMPPKISQAALQDLQNYLFSDDELTDQKSKRVGLSSRNGARTDGVLVIQNGHVLYEKYARGYDANKKHIMWSVSKTIMAILYGVAHKEGLIKLDQSICDFSKFDNTKFCKITIQDMLTWSTGIVWKEEYEGAVKPTESSVLAMLYGQGHHDMAGFVKSQPLEKKYNSGEVWRYSSGDSILASHLLENIFKGEDLRKVFKNKIFDPLGIKDWTWEGDGVGTLGGAYYFHTSVHGLARIGELFLGQGTFRGHKIFKKDFWEFMTTVPESYKKNRQDHKSQDISGAHLWLNKPLLNRGLKAWPAAPNDTVASLGHWGQYLAVIPSERVIVVRTGDTRDKSVDLKGILQRVMALFSAGEVE